MQIQGYLGFSCASSVMSLGFYQVWLNQGVGNISIFISVFKQRLPDISYKTGKKD